MTDAALFIKGADRLRPCRRAARSPHRTEWQVRIDHAQGVLDHIAAIIHFGNDAITPTDSYFYFLINVHYWR
jgi:hypothetical protein